MSPDSKAAPPGNTLPRWSRMSFVVQFGLGVGVAAAVAAALYALVAFPLPFPQSQSLVQVHVGPAPSRPIIVSDSEFDEKWSRLVGPFELVGGYACGKGPTVPTLLMDRTDELRVCGVSGDFFAVLGVAPRLGRVFTAEELRTSAAVAVITEAAWRNKLRGRADVLGTSIRSVRGSYTVIGILDDRLAFPTGAEAWVPIVPFRGPGRHRALELLARLRPQATVGEAGESIERLLAPAPPGTGPVGRILRLVDVVSADVRRPLVGAAVVGVLLVVAVGSVLLHLGLAWAAVRRRDGLIRLALGGTAVGLVRSVVVEYTAVTVAGAVLAGVLARWLVRMLVAVVPRNDYYAAPIDRLDAVVIASCAAAVTLVVPALVYLHVGRALRNGARELGIGVSQPQHSSGTGRYTRATVGTHAAIAVVLAMMAAASMKSFANVDGSELGFVWEDLATFRMGLPAERYRDSEARRRVLDEVLLRIRGLGFAQSAEASTGHLLSRAGRSTEVYQSDAAEPEQRHVTPGFLATIGVRVLHGRDLAPEDGGQEVAVVNAECVRAFFRGDRAIGRMVLRHPPRRIVGVVEDVRDADVVLRQEPVAYLPMGTVPFLIQVVVRLRDGTALDRPAIRRAVASVDRDIRVQELEMVSERLERGRAPWRARASLTTLAGGAAVLLLCLGLWTTLWYIIASDRRAIEIRLALGATRQTIATQLRRRLWAPLLLGTVVGQWAGWVILRAAASQVYGVESFDVLTCLTGVGVGVTPVALFPSIVAHLATRTSLGGLLKA